MAPARGSVYKKKKRKKNHGLFLDIPRSAVYYANKPIRHSWPMFLGASCFPRSLFVFLLRRLVLIATAGYEVGPDNVIFSGTRLVGFPQVPTAGARHVARRGGFCQINYPGFASCAASGGGGGREGWLWFCDGISTKARRAGGGSLHVREQKMCTRDTECIHNARIYFPKC